MIPYVLDIHARHDWQCIVVQRSALFCETRHSGAYKLMLCPPNPDMKTFDARRTLVQLTGPALSAGFAFGSPVIAAVGYTAQRIKDANEVTGA